MNASRVWGGRARAFAPICIFAAPGQPLRNDVIVNVVRVQDHGSQSRKADVVMQGCPAEGIVDSGADITIMNGDDFKRVATECIHQ